MAQYKLKSLLFSEDSGSGIGSTLTATGLGIGGTALAFAAARRGYLGQNLMRQTNGLVAKAGKAIGGKFGSKMVNNAAEKYGASRAMQKSKMIANRLANSNPTQEIINKNNQFLANYQTRATNNFLNKFK